MDIYALGLSFREINEETGKVGAEGLSRLLEKNPFKRANISEVKALVRSGDL